MRYKLWDTDTDTLFGVSDSKAETASLARTLLAGYEGEDADDLELIVETNDGEPRGNFFGSALADWANEVLAELASPNTAHDQSRGSSFSSNPGGLPLAASGRDSRR